MTMTFTLEYLFIYILYTVLIGLVILSIRHLKCTTSSRELILNTISRVQGRNAVWVRDPVLAQLVLSSSDSKGSAIEKLLSCRAWEPLLSMESVDDELWRRMRKSFLIFLKHLPDQEKLAPIIETLVRERLSSGEIIDSRALVQIVIASIVEWIFGLPFKSEWSFVCDASWEWRKEIAIMGKGDISAKTRVIKWIKQLIRESKYYEIFGEKWNHPEYFSLILQPFLLSPAINISDIGVTLVSSDYKAKLEEIGQPLPLSPLEGNITNHIVHAISFSHPFPVLERWLPNGLRDPETNAVLIAPNTQAFIPMDEIFGDCTQFGKGRNFAIAFGGGRRACPGRDIAMSICVPLFTLLLHHPNFKPTVNHEYSGQDNYAKATWSQAIFQFEVLISVLVKLMKQRILWTARAAYDSVRRHKVMY